MQSTFSKPFINVFLFWRVAGGPLNFLRYFQLPQQILYLQSPFY